MNIQFWLNNFMNFWKAYDIQSVLELFTDDVEYYETPFEKVENMEKLREEWQYINKQKNINITCDIVSKDKNIFTIMWNLDYIHTETNVKRILKGVYILKLNDDNKCFYFYQVGELLK